MSGPASSELTNVAMPGHSDEETLGFIPADGLEKPRWGGRLYKVAFAVAAVAGVATTAVYLSSSTARKAAAPTDIGASVGLAQQWRQADEKAKAVVQVLNDKPKDEINTLVQKAMQHAGEKALAERRWREMQDNAALNAALRNQINVCTISDPNPNAGDGVFLSHDNKDRIVTTLYESAPTQWRITNVHGQDGYRIKAIVPGVAGDFLVREPGTDKATLGTTNDLLDWTMQPTAAGPNAAGLFTIKSKTGGAKAYLSRIGKSGVNLAAKGPDAQWKVTCQIAEYSREAQRKATCAFNVLYATQYLARAGLLIQAAARTCPNSAGLLNKICQVNALVIVASFSNLALELSNAASSCAETTNVKALCASAVEALIVSLTTIGAGGIVAATACTPGLSPADLNLPAGASPSNLLGDASPYPARRLFLGGGKANFLGQCILDFTQVAWSLGSVGIAITAAVRDSCPGAIQGTGILVGLYQSACSMDIAAIIYAFSRIALFLALSTIHCTDALNIQALCSGGITALIAAAAALVVTGDAFYIACDKGIKVVNSGGTVPVQLGAAAEAGATRRLAAKALADGAQQTDVHKMVKDLGYNVSNPLKQPTFNSVDSAMRLLEAFDKQQTERYNVGEASLKTQFKGVEELWAHIGFNMSDPKATPASPDRRNEGERFLSIMEPVLSEQDKDKVSAAMAPKPVQKWQQYFGRRSRA